MNFEHLNRPAETNISEADFASYLDQTKCCFVNVSRDLYRLCLIVDGQEFCFATKSSQAFRRCYNLAMDTGIAVFEDRQTRKHTLMIYAALLVALAGVFLFQSFL